VPSIVSAPLSVQVGALMLVRTQSLLSHWNFWPDNQERSNSMCRWKYSNNGYCCTDWNSMVCFARGV